MYRIAVAKPRRLQSTIWGFLDVAEALEYAARMVEARANLCRYSPLYQLVIDVSGAKIQSQEVVGAFQKHIASFPPAERVGVVAGHSLNRYQALKLMDRPHVRVADAIGDAQSWAFGEPLPAEALTIVVEGGRGL